MSVEDTDKIDFTALKPESDEMRLVIPDHRGWGEFEGDHLLMLQTESLSWKWSERLG